MTRDMDADAARMIGVAPIDTEPGGTEPIDTEPVGAEAIAEAVRSHMGGTVEAVEPLAGFVGNRNALVRTTAGDVVVKLGTRPAIAAEAWACSRARAVGVPAPQIVAVEHERLARSYLVMRLVPGKPITDEVSDGEAPREVGLRSRLLADLGRLLRRLHRVPAEGFGYLHAVGPPRDAAGAAVGGARGVARGPEASAYGMVEGVLGQLPRLVSGGVMPRELAGRARTAVEAYGPELTAGAPSTLLHGDLHPRHVYASSGRVTGLIDWGDVAVGDPAMDLGRFSRAGAECLEGVLRGYLAPGEPLNPLQARRIDFYRVVWSMQALVWEYDARGDWFAGHLEAIDGGLAALDGPIDGLPARGPIDGLPARAEGGVRP